MLKARGPALAGLLLLGTGLAGVAAGALGREETTDFLRVGGPAQFPPYAYVDASGEYTGFSVDLMHALGQQLGAENLLLYPAPTADGLRALAAGELDCLFCLRDTSAPPEQVMFVGAYFESPSVLFTLLDRYDLSRPADLASKRVALLPDDPAVERLKRVPRIRLTFTASLESAFALVETGSADAVAGERISTLQALGTRYRKPRFKTVGSPVAWSRFGLAVRRDRRDLARRLRKALTEVRHSGEQDRLLKLWFGEEVQPHAPLTRRVLRWVFVFVGGSLLLAMVVLGWNLLLQRELALKAAAVEKAQLDRNLAEERGRFEAIVQSMTEGLMLVDPNGRIAYVNAQGAQLFGRRSEDLLGRPLAVLQEHLFGQVTEREQLQRRFEQAEANPARPQAIEYYVQTTRRQDIRLKFFPVRDQRGAFAGRGILIEDLTHEREVERLKSEFVSVASHELRTPMTSILGFSELMLTQELPKELGRRYTEQIHGEAERLTRILNDMLDLTYLESGEGVLELRPLQLDDLVREVCESFGAQLKGRRDLRVEVKGGPIRLAGDRDKLAQVLWNLLSNADKYSPPGREVRVEATLRTAPAEDWTREAEEAEWALPAAELRVTDHGQGIPADQLSLIFLPFHRVETAVHTIRGTGLGLAIVRRIVEGHGGRVWARSRPGESTVFTVVLPLHAVDPEPSE